MRHKCQHCPVIYFCYLQPGVVLTHPRAEDDGELVDVRQGGEVGVGGEDFILRHLSLFRLITSLSSLSPLHSPPWHSVTTVGSQHGKLSDQSEHQDATDNIPSLPPHVSSLSRIYSLIISKSLLSPVSVATHGSHCSLSLELFWSVIYEIFPYLSSHLILLNTSHHASCVQRSIINVNEVTHQLELWSCLWYIENYWHSCLLSPPQPACYSRTEFTDGISWGDLPCLSPSQE